MSEEEQDFHSRLAEQKDTKVEMPEILSGKQLVEIVREMFEYVPERVSAHFVESSMLLTLAGMKGVGEALEATILPDGVVDQELVEAVKKANEYFERIYPFVRLQTPGKGSISPTTHQARIWVGIRNLVGFERLSKLTTLPGVVPFEASKGFDALDKWVQQMESGFDQAIQNDKIPKNHLN